MHAGRSRRVNCTGVRELCDNRNAPPILHRERGESGAPTRASDRSHGVRNRGLATNRSRAISRGGEPELGGGDRTTRPLYGSRVDEMTRISSRWETCSPWYIGFDATRSSTAVASHCVNHSNPWPAIHTLPRGFWTIAFAIAIPIAEYLWLPCTSM